MAGFSAEGRVAASEDSCAVSLLIAAQRVACRDGAQRALAFSDRRRREGERSSRGGAVGLVVVRWELELGMSRRALVAPS